MVQIRSREKPFQPTEVAGRVLERGGSVGNGSWEGRREAGGTGAVRSKVSQGDVREEVQVMVVVVLVTVMVMVKREGQVIWCGSEVNCPSYSDIL